MIPRQAPLAALAGAMLLAAGVGLLALVAPAPHAAAPELVVAPLPAASGARPTLSVVERAWDAATPLDLRLHGSVSFPAEIWAAYSSQTIYFRLRWPDTLAGAGTTEQQRSTITWRQSQALGGCAVVCHTSFSRGPQIDDLQMIAPDVTARPFTLLLDTWRNGWWTLGYARPLVTDSPMDIQFLDLRRVYHFGLDIASADNSAHTQGEEVLLRFASN